jgi:hypothetical protein
MKNLLNPQLFQKRLLNIIIIKVWFGVNMENKNDEFCFVGCTVGMFNI